MFHEIAVSNLLSKFKNVITIYKHNIALHQLYYSIVDKPVKVFVLLSELYPQPPPMQDRNGLREVEEIIVMKLLQITKACLASFTSQFAGIFPR